MQHILCKYAKKNQSVKTMSCNENNGKTTYETSTLEVSDPDEFFDSGSTLETRSQESSDADEFVMEATSLTENVESSDADEFMMETTSLTENVENSDPDEFVCAGPTKGTFSSEDSDPDEFIVSILEENVDEDFDEVLLM
jgi:hypothetical protein